jgi:hypothetical protein
LVPGLPAAASEPVGDHYLSLGNDDRAFAPKNALRLKELLA